MTSPPATPEDHRLYVIGDIHGRLDLLNRLLGEIEADARAHAHKTRKIVFLGDYVDRGLDSRGVIERLMGGFDEGLEPLFIRGNHDAMFVQFMKGRLDIAHSWLSLGGAAALASYGILSLSRHVGTGKFDPLHKEVLDKVPAAHVDFLIENTRLSASLGDYFFVHAGVRPDVALEEQKPADMMSIRGDFLFSDANFGKVVVHGHTIRAEPEVKHNRIGIDTGAFATGVLTCLILDGTSREFISTQYD